MWRPSRHAVGVQYPVICAPINGTSVRGATPDCETSDVEDLRYECAFCAGTIMSAEPGWLRLTVGREGTRSFQELLAHRGCLVGKLRPGIPLGEVFEID